MVARGAGVILPIFSLPSRHGIGTLGHEAYRFVDFLERAGMRYWQILPLTPTGYGDSPYQSVSAFAGNTLLVDLDDAGRCVGMAGAPASPLDSCSGERVDYDLQMRERPRVLYEMFRHAGALLESQAYKEFCERESWWLASYCRFMELRSRYGNSPWQEWQTLDAEDSEGEETRAYHAFAQFLFYTQYEHLRRYANEKGIEIIGDMPLYVSLDSADVCDHREWFCLDGHGYPIEVAGVPPDIFSSDGQRWGNPLYNWEVMEEDGFQFWRRRITHAMRLYDHVRIDHFIGLCNYYAIPAASQTARVGEWRNAPGEKLLHALKETGASLIAEDLGVVNERVENIRRDFGLAGMKILQFAFDSDSKNPFLPHNYEKNTVVYGGTHDNETVLGHFQNAEAHELSYACRYFGIEKKDPAAVADAILRAGYASCADTAIFLMQDLMREGNETRINTPSTVGGNWQYRLPRDWESRVDAASLRDLAVLYGRN